MCVLSSGKEELVSSSAQGRGFINSRPEVSIVWSDLGLMRMRSTTATEVGSKMEGVSRYCNSVGRSAGPEPLDRDTQWSCSIGVSGVRANKGETRQVHYRANNNTNI